MNKLLLIVTIFLHLGVYSQSKNGVVYQFVEQMPEYPGGDVELMKFVQRTVVYPSEAIKSNLEGRVIVKFVVNEEGKVDSAVIAKSVAPSLDAEALRVVNLFGTFKPGKQAGKSVKVYYSIPIMFKLSDPKKGKKKDKKKQ
jgi:TonB family protein